MRKLRKTTNPKVAIRLTRRLRIRKKVAGTAARPRVCVTKSNRALNIQVINDDLGATLFSLRTAKDVTLNKDNATQLGRDVAKKAQSMGISEVVFDRSGNLYHGRVAAFAAGAREAGLNF
jgi:large subunit ribosomal protein L18